jgi:creatinine amidohydrolase
MRFGNLTYLEIKELITAGSIAIVPTGCTEQQGPHLTVDFDTWLAETICLAAAARAQKEYGMKALVLPAVPIGPTPEHRNYAAGYVDLPHSLHIKILLAILTSLADQGFQRIIVWRGCGQHNLDDMQKSFNKEFAGQTKVYLPAWSYHEIWCRLGDSSISGGHADSFATSIALFLRPEAVRLDRIYNPNNREVDWSDPQLDFFRYSTSGVIGDPTHARAELGAKMWKEVVDSAALSFYNASNAEITE